MVLMMVLQVLLRFYVGYIGKLNEEEENRDHHNIISGGWTEQAQIGLELAWEYSKLFGTTTYNATLWVARFFKLLGDFGVELIRK